MRTEADNVAAFIEDTVIEAPETPAPVFAVRAFKNALFGTPQPAAVTDKRRPLPKKDGKPSISLSTKDGEEKARPELNLSSSPVKPQGILVTPGTATLRRKQVTFGEHVVDNEGKKPITRSGIPSNCPGKFPSSFTPKTIDSKSQESADTESSIKAANLQPLRSNPISEVTSMSAYPSQNKTKDMEPKQITMPRAKDDADLTLTVLDPKSESGKYWKQQYISYSANSEEEVKKLIAKAKVAKDYAKKKDEEAMEVRQKLETERRKRQAREKALEKEVKDLQERLRVTLAENAKTVMELAALRQQLGKQTLESPQESSKTELEKQPTPDVQSLWSAVASSDGEPSYVPKSATARPKRTKSAKEPREKPVNQLEGIRTREQASTPPVDFFKTVLSPVKGSPSSPLQPRSPNIVSSPPRVRAKPSKSQKSEYRKDNQRDKLIDAIFDPSATAEALSMQADQPITPASVQKERQHRVAGKTPPIPSDRAAAAKQRLAAKRKEREAVREKKVKMNTVI